MEDKKQNSDAQTSEASQNEEQEGAKTFTQDELNKVISERLSQEKKKFEKELSIRLAKEKEEAERLAKLSADEKEKELVGKQMEELRLKEREVSLRENKLKAISVFDEAKIPLKLVDFVVDVDAEKMEEKITSLKETWQNAVSDEVSRQLKGTAPKDVSSDQSKSRVKVKTSF